MIMQGSEAVSDVTDADLKMAPCYKGQQLDSKHGTSDDICASMLNTNHGNLLDRRKVNNMNLSS